MTEYHAWITPYPGYKDGQPFPVSSRLHLIETRFDPELVEPMALRGARHFTLTKMEVEEFIRYDAEHWSWKKTGNSRNEFFDRCHFNALYEAMVCELAHKSKLDFSEINAGVRV